MVLLGENVRFMIWVRVQVTFNSYSLVIEKSCVSVKSGCVLKPRELFREEMLMTEIQIGDKMDIPVHSVFHQEMGHVGKVVYISENGNIITVKCDRKHGGKAVAFNVALKPTEE